MGKLRVLTWLWSQPGGRASYGPENVNVWAAMVRRHLAMPHEICCVTDHPEGIDPSVRIIRPPEDFAHVTIPTWGPRKPQCLRRLAMFSPDAGKKFGERFVCMDLDCVITGPLDPLFDVPDDFKMMIGTDPSSPRIARFWRASTSSGRTRRGSPFVSAGARRCGPRTTGPCGIPADTRTARRIAG
jgi:hypothetical protein